MANSAALVMLMVLAPAQAARATIDRDEPDFGAATENVKEVAHRVRVTVGPSGWARATVTRTFEARQPGAPVALLWDIQLPADAVVTAFAIDTNGRWRSGRLRREPAAEADGGSAGPAIAAGKRPWAAMEWVNGNQVQVETSLFRTSARFSVRYAISARGESTRAQRRWVFCPDEPDGAPPEIELVPPATGVTKQELRPSDEAPGCRAVVATRPPQRKLAPRYASYRLGPRSWLWRVELRVPPSVLPVPPPPDLGPVVFVLDASRSQAANGGLATQLAIARAYLASAPRAEVEVLLVARTAERLFGRLVPAAEFERALPVDLGKRPLGNGSFLDRGVALAGEILARAGRPGRVVVMTDGDLRAAFDRRAAIASLRRAPAGTVAHLVYPGAWTDAEVSPWEAEGLIEIAAALGGASYQISVGKRGQAPDQAHLVPLVRRLVWPDRVEQIELHDLGSRAEPAWPPLTDSPFFTPGTGEVQAGEEMAWSAVSTTRPPARLALTGRIWSRKVDIPLRPDADLARELPWLATADTDTMECATSGERHAAVALAGGFLAPRLLFWVSGGGHSDRSVTGSFGPDCGAGLSGSGHGDPPPAREELPPSLVKGLSPCGLGANPDGQVVVKLETQGNEILDVAVQGAGEQRGHCAEEALWNARLPDKFNDGGRRGRQVYQLRFAPSP